MSTLVEQPRESRTPEEMSATDILNDVVLAECQKSDDKRIRGVSDPALHGDRQRIWEAVAERYAAPPAHLRQTPRELLVMEAVLRLEDFLQLTVDGAEHSGVITVAMYMQEGLLEQLAKDSTSWDLLKAVLEHKEAARGDSDLTQ